MGEGRAAGRQISHQDLLDSPSVLRDVYSAVMGDIRFGTCSWKFDSWRGLVYPETGSFDYLREYAGKYDTVEVDQWFWSLHGPGKVTLPRPAVVRGYVEAVPADFRFSVKVPNSLTLTHYYRSSKSEPLVENPHFLCPETFGRFLDLLAPMKERLGPLMFQFEYLNLKKMPSQEEFMERFARFRASLPEGYVYGIETRNPKYLNRAYFDFLARAGLYHVFIQGYYMPSIFDVYAEHVEHIENFTVIRLHGPDRQGIEKKTGKIWDSIAAPKDHEITKLKAMLADLDSRGVTTYVNVNNHYEGSAPLTIERIRRAAP
jgi:uncharacterized protein YecE (DUF72 family)